MKNILLGLVLFCLGAAGGVWAQAFLIPAVTSSPLFENWGVAKNWTARMLVINQTERVVVTQNEAEGRAIENARKKVAGVESTLGRSVVRGSAVIMTSDGLVLTLNSLVPPRSVIRLYLEGREDPVEQIQIVKRDSNLNLALLKIEETNLSTLGFEESRLVRPGLPVLLVGKEKTEYGVGTVAGKGTVRAVLPDAVQTNIFESGAMRGAPLVSVRERLVGLGVVDPATGKVEGIPADILRTFLGL